MGGLLEMLLGRVWFAWVRHAFRGEKQTAPFSH